MTPKQFALLIEKRASQKRISHMEAVLDYCQEKEIEPDQVKHLINRNLKEKIKANTFGTVFCIFSVEVKIQERLSVVSPSSY